MRSLGTYSRLFVRDLQGNAVEVAESVVLPKPGQDLAAVERAIAMSHEKYCSASIMLGKTAAITTGFTLVEATTVR